MNPVEALRPAVTLLMDKGGAAQGVDFYCEKLVSDKHRGKWRQAMHHYRVTVINDCGLFTPVRASMNEALLQCN